MREEDAVFLVPVCTFLASGKLLLSTVRGTHFIRQQEERRRRGHHRAIES